METFSALLALCARNSPVIGKFPSQTQVTRSFDIFFDLRLNTRLSKQSWGWWFETPSRLSWRHCNVFQPHYSDFTWESWSPNSPANWLFPRELVYANNTHVSVPWRHIELDYVPCNSVTMTHILFSTSACHTFWVFTINLYSMWRQISKTFILAILFFFFYFPLSIYKLLTSHYLSLRKQTF